MRVLIVEDDPLLGDALGVGLKQRGFEPDWVQDGPDPIEPAFQDCRERLSARDLLLLDEHVLGLIALTQQPDDAARIPTSD